MTRVETSNICFGCRVAGVILHDDYVLLQGEPRGAFWTLPGGSVELLESSHDALKREMQEELGVDVRIKRLLWIVEQFFISDGKVYHELGLYFLIAPLDAPHLYELDRTFQAIDGVEDEIDIIFQWFKLDDLANVPLYPSFLQAALRALPPIPEHIILPSSDFRGLDATSGFESHH
ncbi:MAG: NUDIX hydrolase [Chloroflexota bacterium]|nr:NUDIX hydrolase [Chloroflexota bacterium]